MKWHKTDWPLLRDVGITGTALVVIWVQLGLWAALGRVPSPTLVGLAGSLLAPAVYAHVRHLWSASSSSESSPSRSHSPSQSSSSHEEAPSGEH